MLDVPPAQRAADSALVLLFLAVARQHDVSRGECGTRARECGVSAQCRLKKLDRAAQVGLATAFPDGLSLQIEFVRLDVLRRCFFALSQLLFFRRKLDLQPVDDGLRDFVLYRENVFELAVVRFGPEMETRSRCR